MSLPVTKTWAPGIWSVGDANAYIKNPSDFLLSPPMVILQRNNADIELTDQNDFVPVEWDTVVHNTDDMFSLDKPSIINIRTSGVYLFSFQAHWTHDTGTWPPTMELRYNGGQRFNMHSEALTDGHMSFSPVHMLKLDADKYIDFIVRIGSGGGDGIRMRRYDPGSSFYGSQCEVRWLCAG